MIGAPSTIYKCMRCEHVYHFDTEKYLDRCPHCNAIFKQRYKKPTDIVDIEFQPFTIEDSAVEKRKRLMIEHVMTMGGMATFREAYEQTSYIPTSYPSEDELRRYGQLVLQTALESAEAKRKQVQRSAEEAKKKEEETEKEQFKKQLEEERKRRPDICYPALRTLRRLLQPMQEQQETTMEHLISTQLSIGVVESYRAQCEHEEDMLIDKVSDRYGQCNLMAQYEEAQEYELLMEDLRGKG